MKLAASIAFRYLFSKKSTNAINIISYISMIGMGLGAFVIVVLLSVFNGFEEVVLQLQSSFYADIEIKKTEGKVFEPSEDLLNALRNTKGVAALSQVLEENAYVSYDGASSIAKVKGYDEAFNKVNTIDDFVVQGSPALKDDGRDYALLGAGIQNIIAASSIEPISISVPKRGSTSSISATQLFNTAQIFPGGVFEIQNEFNNVYIITPISFLRKIQAYDDEVSSLELAVSKDVDPEKIANVLKKSLGDEYQITTRLQQNKSLYQAMQAEKYAMIAIMFLVLLIISFTIVGALSMLAMEKKLDISILKAMGANKAFVFKLFLLQGILGSLLGAFVGVILGVLTVAAQQIFGFIKLGGDGGFVVDAYPVKLELLDVLIAFALIIVISLLASFLPAKRAAEGKMLFVKY